MNALKTLIKHKKTNTQKKKKKKKTHNPEQRNKYKKY